jgi:hypothetical protein
MCCGVEVIRNTEYTAKKIHHCDACDILFECLYDLNVKLTFTEWRAIAKAKEAGYKIFPGEKYINQFNKMDGHTFSFKAIPAIHDICCKYDLYCIC